MAGSIEAQEPATEQEVAGDGPVILVRSSSHLSEPPLYRRSASSVHSLAHQTGSYPASAPGARASARSMGSGSLGRRTRFCRSATVGGGWLTELGEDGTARDLPAGGATLAKLFLSGKCATVRFDDKESVPDASTMTPLQLLENEDLSTFPDPPCVIPFDYKGDEGVQAAYAAPSGTPTQSYWKSHADWKGGGEQVEELRRQAAAFAAAWQSQSTDFYTGWVNISPSPIGIRKEARLDDSSRTGLTIQPGQCVMVQSVEKDDGGVNFLELADGSGWLFDSAGGEAVMAEMKELEAGAWWHRLVCRECVDVRNRPVYDVEAKTGRLMVPSELAVVDLRCRVRGSVFVRLMDGRGWVFVLRPGIRKNDHGKAFMVMEECDFEESARADLRRLVPPTHLAVEVGSWTYTVGVDPALAIGAAACGTFLNPGDIVKVDKRAYADGDAPRPEFPSVRWLRLSDLRGWVMEVDHAGKELMKERELNETSSPSWFVGTRNLDEPKEAWMVGKV